MECFDGFSDISTRFGQDPMSISDETWWWSKAAASAARGIYESSSTSSVLFLRLRFLLFPQLPPFTLRILSTKHPRKWGPLTRTPGASPAPLYQCDNELPRANESKHQSCRDSRPCTEAGGCFQGFQAAKYPPAHLQLELERLMWPFIDGSRD